MVFKKERSFSRNYKQYTCKTTNLIELVISNQDVSVQHSVDKRPKLESKHKLSHVEIFCTVNMHQGTTNCSSRVVLIELNIPIKSF